MHLGEKPRYKFNSTGPVLGVVGGSYSSVSLQVNILWSLRGLIFDALFRSIIFCSGRQPPLLV